MYIFLRKYIVLPPNLVSVAEVHDQYTLPPSVESVASAMKNHGFDAKYHTIKVTFHLFVQMSCHSAF